MIDAASRYLGVDGGGTKTEFVCIDGDGRVLARTVTGTTYHLEVGVDEAAARIAAGVASICDALGTTPSAFDHVFFGLPAFGEDATADPLLEAACGRVLGHARFACGNDMICGWAGSLGGEDGINVVAGTGSIGYGENGRRAARVGGWGEVFGDEGSAYWIAVRGLAAFSRMADGREAPGPLQDLLRGALALDGDLDLLARIMGPRGRTRGEIAALADTVSAAARTGDAAAGAILAAAGRELADLAITLRRDLRFDAEADVAVSWSGGVLTREPLVRAPFLDALEQAGGFRLTQPRQTPSIGAALYARRLRAQGTGTEERLSVS